jgi:ABC-2 type transport system ATP-binding protein
VVIRTQDLTKHYGQKVGCEKICLQVRRGHIFGFLGPNGAGKSTFVKMMVGLIHPTFGDAEVLGHALGDTATRTRIGFLPEQFRYHDWLTPKELLAFHGDLVGMDRATIALRTEEVLAEVGLADEADAKIRSFSKGMQQRLGLASALLSDPELLFLDEPTSALDPRGRKHVRELLVGLRERGMTVFLNSHLLSEVEMVCDEVAVIDHGRIVASGPLDELLSGPCEVEIRLAEPFGAGPSLAEASADVLTVEEDRLLVRLPDEADIPELIGWLVSSGARVSGVERRKRTLEGLFLEAVGEEDTIE